MNVVMQFTAKKKKNIKTKEIKEKEKEKNNRQLF